MSSSRKNKPKEEAVVETVVKQPTPRPVSHRARPQPTMKSVAATNSHEAVDYTGGKSRGTKPAPKPIPKVEVDLKVIDKGRGINPNTIEESNAAVMKGIVPYGPKMNLDHAPSNMVASSVGIYFSAAWCSNIAAAICSVAASASPSIISYTGSTPVNMNYVYQFIANYLINVASGVVNSPELDFAPAVLYDIEYAMNSKKRGSIIFYPQTTGSLVVDTTSVTCGNSAFGVMGAQDATSKYMTLTSSGSGYTATLGAANCAALFSSMSRVLDVVEKAKYPDPWAKDEVGIFCARRGAVDSSATKRLYGFTANNVDQGGDYYGFCTYLGKKPCEWLMRIAPGTVVVGSHPYAAGKQINNYICAPSAMVVHRILRRLRGYGGQYGQPVVKAVDFYSILNIWSNLVARATTVSGTAFFSTNGLGVHDCKMAVWLQVTRYIGRWQSVSIGMYDDRNGTKYQFAPSGSYSNVTMFDSFVNFAVFFRNLACLYPYNRGNVYYYPCIIANLDPTLSGSNYAASPTQYGANWNITTNLVSGLSSEVALASMVGISTVATYINAWATAMQQFSPYLPTATFIDEQPLNAASVTRYGTGGAGTYNVPIAGMSFKALPDHVAPVLAQLFIPFMPIASLDQRNEYMALYREPEFNTGVGSGVNAIVAVTSAILQAVHPIGGFGSFFDGVGEEQTTNSFWDFRAVRDNYDGAFGEDHQKEPTGTSSSILKQVVKEVQPLAKEALKMALEKAKKTLPREDPKWSLLDTVLQSFDSQTVQVLTAMATVFAQHLLVPPGPAPVGFLPMRATGGEA